MGNTAISVPTVESKLAVFAKAAADDENMEFTTADDIAIASTMGGELFDDRRLAEVSNAGTVTTCTLASAGLLLAGFIGYHLFKRWRLPGKPVQKATEDSESWEAKMDAAL